MNKFALRFAPVLALAAAAGPVMAQATNPLVTVLESVDLAGVSAAVIAVALLIIGIAMAFKGGKLGKRAVNSV